MNIYKVSIMVYKMLVKRYEGRLFHRFDSSGYYLKPWGSIERYVKPFGKVVE